MAATHLACCAPPVEQPANGREPLQRTRADLVNAFRGKAGALGCHQTAVVRLYGIGQRRGTAVIKPPFGLRMEIGDMARQLVHQRYAQPAGLSEGVEQRRLLEAQHDHDPIDRWTIGCKADFSVRHATECSDFEIERRRRTAVQKKLGFAGPPTVLRCGEVQVRIFYGTLKLIGAVAGEEHQRHMRFNDIDPLYCRPIGGWLAQKRDNVLLIIRHG